MQRSYKLSRRRRYAIFGPGLTYARMRARQKRRPEEQFRAGRNVNTFTGLIEPVLEMAE